MNPFKVILFLIILGLIIFFIGFNLTNVSDISIGFHTFEDVPIFISLFIAFAAGVVVMLPVVFFRKKKIKKDMKDKISPPALPDVDDQE